MEQYADVVQDLAGNVVPEAVVRVLLPNGGPATIFDVNGAETANPTPCDSQGYFAFQAANGKYFPQVEVAGKVYKKLGPVTLFDYADVPAPSGLYIMPQDNMTEAQRMNVFLRLGTLDVSQAIATTSLYAESVGRPVHYSGVYGVGAASALRFDPLRTSWLGDGKAALQFLAAPVGGAGVVVASSEASAYNTAHRMNRTAWDGLDILGGPSSGNRFAGTALQIGDDVNQTFGLSFKNISIQGFTTLLDYRNNVWWISFDNPRFAWGAITSPTPAGNWGECNTFTNAKFLDGVTVDIYHGDWKFFGGSCDNTKFTTWNETHLAWFGPHIENPGTTTLIQAFFDAQGESTIDLSSPSLVIGENGTPIEQSPFNSADGNPNGIILNNIQYTNGPHAGWYTLVSGKGRVRATRPQRLALSNGYAMVFAENTKGQLRNYDFETGDLTGWTTAVSGTSTVTVSSVRKARGTYSALLTVSGVADGYADATLVQKIGIGAGDLLAMRFAYSRDFTGAAAGGVLTGQIVWLDASGAQIGTTTLGYYPAPQSTNDGSSFYSIGFNGDAPGGTCFAEIQFNVQRASGAGTVRVYFDKIFVNVLQ